MIPRGWTSALCALLLASLPVCRPVQFTPLDSQDCALMLGADRSSFYEYGTNLLRGSLNFGGASCITYDAVNQAYIEARKRIHVTVPPVDVEWKTAEIAKVGELLMDITTQLTKAYGLSLEEVETGLPQIDTSKTLIQEVCPPYLSDVECHPGKYRRLDGLCNNVNNPSWGATMTPFTRLVPPQFADGLNAPRQSVLGSPLPLPRIVSRTLHPDDGFHDHAGTVMVVAWGQFMDHDFTLTATPLDPRNKNDPEECCDRPPHLKHPYCLEIRIPDDDYFYKGFNVKCMDFVRSFPSARPGCRLGSKIPYNTLTGVIDGNTVYGVDEQFGRRLRSLQGGQLRMNPAFAEYGLKDLLPLKLDVPDEGCTRTNSSQFCFEAGEIRVNEQLVLTCMHTLMAREHNRAARALSTVNPHWDDETLYQEARRIVIAEIQHITFNEFLPIILGKDVMSKFGLMLQKEGYWDGYDTTVNPNIIAAFSAAAFRFGHSLLPTAVERWSKAHKFISSKRLSDLIRRPYDLYRAGVMDEYLMGLMNQVAQAMDDSITQEVTNHLLKKPGHRFGLDLVSFNMQRGREFGIPGYMQYRKFCGLPTADSFEELFGSMPNSTVYRYASIYAHPNDIDLWSGGVSERPLPGSMIGPTFACIIASQLSFARRGDRFWYELPNQPSSFTPEQLQEIRKVKLSRVLCDNTDLLDTVQVYPMVLPDHEINPRVPCRAGILPSIDFTKWVEFPNPSQYNNTKATSPSHGEVIIVCNGSNGCSVPSSGYQTPTGSGVVDDKGVKLEEQNEDNVISIIATSPTLYIQRLKRWFGEQLGGQRNRTKRTKRSSVGKGRGSVRFNSSSLAERESTSRKNQDEKLETLTDGKFVTDFREPIFYPKKKSNGQRSNSSNSSKRKTTAISKESTLTKVKENSTNNTKKTNAQKVSRSDPEYFDDTSVGFIKTTKNNRRGSNHYSLFKNPTYDSSEDTSSDSEFSKAVLLGGSNRHHDGTTPFPIVDADHDYEAEYEYTKNDSDQNDKSEEEGESSVEQPREEEEETPKNYEREEDSDEHVENYRDDGMENTDEDVEVLPKMTVFLGNTATVQPSFGFEEDVQERYISKDPLAGPGATRGFNHDFQVMRGAPIRGTLMVLPNNRYPIVPGFNTSQIHNIINTGRLPGIIGVGINGTKIGLPTVEPARHAGPNDLGQYLNIRQPGRGRYRRPVYGVRGRTKYYVGRSKSPYSLGPVRGQRVVLLNNRNPRYRQPIRIGPQQLSYPVRGQTPNRFYGSSGPRSSPVLRVLEDRSSNEEQLLTENNYKHEGPKNSTVRRIKIPKYQAKTSLKLDNDGSELENKTKIRANSVENLDERYNMKETKSRFPKSSEDDERITETVNGEDPHDTVEDDGKSNNYQNNLKQDSLESFVSASSEEDSQNETPKLMNHRLESVEDNRSSKSQEDDSRSVESTSNESEGEKSTDYPKNDKGNYYNTIKRIIDKTYGKSDDEIIGSNDKPISHNKYWSLEYSYPNRK